MANIGFISLGCAKNQVDCERMMYRVQEAGHTGAVKPAQLLQLPVTDAALHQQPCLPVADDVGIAIGGAGHRFKNQNGAPPFAGS